jgi:hypothetical protein
VGLTALVGGCRDDGVTIAFRPVTGARYDYRTHVASVAVTTLPGERPVTRTDETNLAAAQEVLDADDQGVQVEVVLSRPGIGSRTFTVRFDRAAQLTRVEQVEGIPAEALGDLGLSEIFPAAAGAPPDSELSPGDRWTVDDEVQLDGQSDPVRLAGEGRLVSVGVEGGDEVATVRTTTALPVRTTTRTSAGTQELDGSQTTTSTVVYDLADGSVRRATAVTTATFRLVLSPPAGTPGTPVRGTLELSIRSEVVRQA